MKRKQPARSGPAIIYGVHPVVETLKAGRRQIQEIYLARDSFPQLNLNAQLEASQIPLVRVSGNELLSIAGSPNHQGLAARVGSFPYVEFSDIVSTLALEQRPILVLDAIQDPANLGSILRSAECLGAAAVILSKDRSVAVTPAVEKTSAGAAAHVPVAKVVNLVRDRTAQRIRVLGIRNGFRGKIGLFHNRSDWKACICAGLRGKRCPASRS